MAHLTPTIYQDAKDKGMNARFILFMGKRLANGTHPVMLQVTKGGKSDRYGLGISCKEEQWDGYAMRMKVRAAGATDANRTLNRVSTNVEGILKRLEVFETLTLEAFREQYRNPKAIADVLAFMDGLVDEMERAGKVGNAATYRNTARIIRRFTGRKPLPFTDLTAAKLEKLEHHLRDEGCTGGGISVYMRTLRAVVGKAMKAGMMHPDQYPFETGTRQGYSMKGLKSERNPRAIGELEMDKLKGFPFDKAPHLAESVRYFIFSYYARGINFVDIAHLKPENIVEGRLIYRRQKTKGKKGREAEFSIKVSEALSSILATFEHEGSYLFPILGPEHVTEKQKWTRIRKCLKKVNRDLKQAAEVVGIRTPLTSYVARHTFATTLKRKGVDLALISESMGHGSLSTTQAYFASFASDVLDKADTML